VGLVRVSKTRGTLIKKILAGVLALILGLTLPSYASSLSDFTRPKTPGTDVSFDQTVTFQLWEDTREQNTHVAVDVFDQSTGKTSGRICTSWDAPDCSRWLRNTDVRFQDRVFIVPVCEGDRDRACIESVRFSEGSEVLTAAVFEKSLPGTAFPAIPELGMPEGGTTSLWSAPLSSGDLRFAVTIQMDVLDSQRIPNRFEVQTFRARIIPFVEIPGDFSPHACFESEFRGNFGVSCGGIPEECAWTQSGTCGAIVDFPANVTFSLGMRMPKTVKGWFAGRLEDPAASVVEIDKSSNLITLNGRASRIPALNLRMAKSDATSEARELVGTECLSGAFPCWSATSTEGAGALRSVEAFRRNMSDTASYEHDIWLVGSFAAGQQASRCAADGFVGLATTNAMAFEGALPQLVNNRFEYKVAGMHFLSSGEKAKGVYELHLRSDFARCIYGFSKAPVSAEIQVLNEAGGTAIATTTVGERNGWIRLAVYDFDFSEKDIKVRITQSQTRTLTSFSGRSTLLTSKQKSEIRATIAKGAGNSKFICTGIRLEGQPASANTLVRQRAKSACDYAKSLNPKLSTFFQTKTTKARSFNGKVLVVSK
jgi:hypothetical protein